MTKTIKILLGATLVAGLMTTAVAFPPPAQTSLSVSVSNQTNTNITDTVSAMYDGIITQSVNPVPATQSATFTTENDDYSGHGMTFTFGASGAGQCAVTDDRGNISITKQADGSQGFRCAVPGGNIILAPVSAK